MNFVNQIFCLFSIYNLCRQRTNPS